MTFFVSFHVYYMLSLDKASYLWLLFKFILSVRLSNSLSRLDALLFLEFINIVSILYYKFIELIMLLYTRLIISFAWCKEYVLWWISFSKFSDLLSAFTCARGISSYWIIYFAVNILRSKDMSGRRIFPWNFSSLILLSFVMIISYIFSKKLFLKRRGLSAAKVLSFTKKYYGFAAHFCKHS